MEHCPAFPDPDHAPRHELGAARERLFLAICALEHEVGGWLATPAAWNRRNHALIRQFLTDVREQATALDGRSGASPHSIVAATERLAAKVRDAAVYQRVDDLHGAFAAYLSLLNAAVTPPGAAG
ncbi:MAG: hypothetical protein ABW069_08570 [Duganella sp.]